MATKATQPQFGLTQTQEEVRAFRGTPQQTMQRIRQKHGLGRDVSDYDIFYRCIRFRRGEEIAKKTARVEYERYGVFIAQGVPATYELPLLVARAGDPDMDYRNMDTP